MNYTNTTLDTQVPTLLMISDNLFTVPIHNDNLDKYNYNTKITFLKWIYCDKLTT